MSESTSAIDKNTVREALKSVIDPDIHINIVELGLIYDVRPKPDVIEVDMTLTSPACPYGPMLIHEVNETVLAIEGAPGAEVFVVWDPPWGPERMSEEVRLELGFDV